MAKKRVGNVGLLPDGRALRARKMNTPQMLELTKRIGRQFPAGKDIPTPSHADVEVAMEMAMIGSCVTGITLTPVVFVTKTREPSAEEVKAAEAAGRQVPGPVEYVDFDETLRSLADNPNDTRWTPLGELQLENMHEDNELSMFALFDEPRAWQAAVAIVNDSAGSTAANPFAGKLLRTSAG